MKDVGITYFTKAEEKMDKNTMIALRPAMDKNGRVYGEAIQEALIDAGKRIDERVYGGFLSTHGMAPDMTMSISFVFTRSQTARRLYVNGMLMSSAIEKMVVKYGNVNIGLLTKIMRGEMYLVSPIVQKLIDGAKWPVVGVPKKYLTKLLDTTFGATAATNSVWEKISKRRFGSQGLPEVKWEDVWELAYLVNIDPEWGRSLKLRKDFQAVADMLNDLQSLTIGPIYTPQGWLNKTYFERN